MNKLKVCILSNITFDLIKKQWTKSSEIESVDYRFDSIIPSLINPDDVIRSADFVVVHLDAFFHKPSNEELKQVLETVLQFAQNNTTRVLLSNMLHAFPGSNLQQHLGDFIHLAHLEPTLSTLKACPNVFFYDVQQCIMTFGMEDAYNFRLGHLYQMPYKKPVLKALASLIYEQMVFLSQEEKKVIILDCDNTLWRGVIGEDGLEGIACDNTEKGIFHLHLQRFLKQKKEEGFLLCLCSKNNEADAKEAFDELHMPLKWEDFVIKKVNWEAKVQNIKSIADELNLGINSFIFLDDSDFETGSVAEYLPEVRVFQIDGHYKSLLDLMNAFCFKRKNVLAADAQKTKNYLQEQQRNNIKDQTGSIADYIASLEIQLDLYVNEEQHLTRLAQMTGKTNQFNFNKEAFEIKDLEAFIAKGDRIYGLKVADKFGDYGIVGFAFAEIEEEQTRLRNFLLSCRALGRGIEDQFFELIKADLAKNGKTIDTITFQVTERNVPAQKYYENLKITP